MQKLAAPNKVIRARAYIRVSYVGKDRQDTLLSDAMQLDEAARYADYQEFEFDADASRLNADLDVSGFRKPWRQRPGLIRHFEDAKRGEFDALIFYKISRLGRNVREALDLIDAFENLGVSFHFVAEKIDSSSAQGRFLRNVLLAAAEMQSEDSAAFLKSTFLKRALSGKHHGALPGWLYKVEGGEIGVNEDVAATMRRMVELRMAGLGHVAIARTLNNEGRRTCTQVLWTQYMVSKFLRRDWIETMQGTSFFGRGKAEPIRIPNALPAILSLDEAEKLIAVNELYSEEFRSSPRQAWDRNRPKGHDGRYSAGGQLLSGILWCPRCQRRMVAWHSMRTYDRRQQMRYTCPHYNTQRIVHPPNTGSIIGYSIEDAVLRVVRHVLAKPPEPVIVDKARPAKSVEHRLSDIQLRIDKLVEMNLRGRLSDDDFTRHYEVLLAERASVDFDSRDAEQTALANQVHHLSSKGDLTREELRQLVLILVDRVEANVEVEGFLIRAGRNARKFARVTLRFPAADGSRIFLAPLHTAQYCVPRQLYYSEKAPIDGVVRFPDREFSIVTL